MPLCGGELRRAAAAAPTSTASEASACAPRSRSTGRLVLARPQDLHRGLLGREARGEALGVDAGAGPALGELGVGVDALEVAVAVRADGFLHAGYGGQIDSHSDWHTRQGSARTVVRAVRLAGERGVRRRIPCACTRRCRGFPAPDGGRNLRRRERHAHPLLPRRERRVAVWALGHAGGARAAAGDPPRPWLSRRDLHRGGRRSPRGSGPCRSRSTTRSGP